MKRRLPTSPSPPSPSSPCRAAAALALLLLPQFALSSSITFVDGVERKKLDFEEQCQPLLKLALKFDGDDTGGLDRLEFSSFWSDGANGGTDSTPLYDTLLCECYYTFDEPISCCDDTYSMDDDWTDDWDSKNNRHDSSQQGNDNNNNDNNNKSIVATTANGYWKEVSLAEFATDNPGKTDKQYHKQFCKRVQEMMEWEGIKFKDVNFDYVPPPPTATNATQVASTVASVETTEAPETTTTTAITTAATTTTTEEPPTTTEEPIVTTTTEQAEATTTTSPEPEAEEGSEPPTSAPTPEVTTTPPTAAPMTTTTATATTAVAAPVNSSEDGADVDARTTAPTPGPTAADVATTAATTAATAAATAAATTTTAAEIAPPEIAPSPIAVTFVGSTNGNVEADTASDEFLDKVAHAFWRVGMDVLEEMDVLAAGKEEEEGVRRRLSFADLGDEFGVYFDRMRMHAEDADCPSGLVYAAAGAPCIEFTYTLTPLPSGPLTEESLLEEFASEVEYAANVDGELYEKLIETYPDTEMVGMGSPGRGVPYDDAANTNQQTESVVGLNAASSKSVATSGFPVGGIVGAALAAVLVVVLLAMVLARRGRRRREEREEVRQRELNDSNSLSEDVEATEVNADASRVEDWLDGSDREMDEDRLKRQTSPASSLAAMGVASTVATRLTTGDTEVMLSSRTPWSRKEPEV